MLARTRSFIGLAAAASCLATCLHPAVADEFVVDSFHVGAFYDGPLIPDNDPIFQNYFVGHTTVGGFTTTERRAFFAFDLGALEIPAGHAVTTVELELESLFGGVIANFSGGDEVVVFTAVHAPYEMLLDPTAFEEPTEVVFEMLGGGPEYGMLAFTHEGPPPGAVVVPFGPDASLDVEAIAAEGGILVVGASLFTYDPEPGVPYEFCFGLSDVVVDGIPTGLPSPALLVETAPASLEGDVNGDGAVDGTDLTLVLGAWGSSSPVADLDGSGVVDGADLALVLANWSE